MNQETKLGLFVLVGIIALATTIVFLGDFQFQRSYYLNILFNDIAGLPAKAKVKISGVEVGAVKDITLAENKAKVTVWIKKDIVIHADCRASIVATGLIGSKYLELTTGDPNTPILKDGDTIVGVTPLSFDKIVETAMEQLHEILNAFKGTGGRSLGQNLSETLDNLRKVSESLRVALYDQEDRVNRIVSNIDNFTGDLADITGDNKENLKSALANIKSASEKLDRLLAGLDKGEGTIGKLMADKEMGEDLKATFNDLKETTKEAKRALRRINYIETQWDYELRYDSRYSVAKSDIGLRFNPSPGKFYYIGASNVGEASLGDNNPEEYNTINLLIGKSFGPTTLYGGIIRKKAGLGVKVKPFWNWQPLKKLEITVEGYDFARKVPVNSANANVGMRYPVTKWAYVGTQLEDPSSRSSVNTYVNFVIRDDDLGYLLGLVGLARP
ncbi:MAG: MCE family protein [Elusimicrobia bacterium]|nr:MCE family protein [Candidatus Liberimonas magnetica]